MAARPRHAHVGSGVAASADLAHIRVLLVDGDQQRRAAHRQWIEIAGGPEPEIADTGDEALDILGARSQQFDLVAFWPVLRDADDVDLCGVLRRCRSPVRLMAVTATRPDGLPRPGRLAGVGAVDGTATPRGFVQAVRAQLAEPASVADIVATKTVPRTLDRAWAEAIYGTPPGGRFHANLD